MSANLTPYPAMKDSGVEWLGDVPEHWEVLRLRNAAELRVSNVDKHVKEDERPVRLCNYVDVYKHDFIGQQIDFMRATAMPEEIERFRLEEGDVLITKDSEAWDDIGVPALVVEPADDLISGYHLALLRPFADQLCGGYLLRALQSKGLAYQFHVEAKGVTRYGLSHASIKSVWLPVPPLPEQDAIVRYLDHVDRRVRRLVRAKRRQIELLNEEKQAIIHQAVTRGLDPNVRLKPSGIDWLGDVPENYTAAKMRRVCRSIRDGTHNPPPALPGNYRLLSVRNIVDGKFVSRDDDRTMGTEAFSELQGSYTIEPGDVVVALVGATTGKSAVVEPMENVTVQRSIGILRPNHNVIDSAFLNLEIQCALVQQQIKIIMHKYAAQPGIYLDDLSSLRIVFPDLIEQRQIVRNINKRCGSLDSETARATTEIDLLREYRTRLISDLVTGKLDVRGVSLQELEDGDETEYPDLEEAAELDDLDDLDEPPEDPDDDE